MNANTPIDDEGVGRLDEVIREQQRILASRETEERRPANVRPSKMRPTRRPHPAIRYVAVLVVLAIVGVVAAVVVISQSWPAVPPSALHANCSGLSSSIATVPVGGSGDLEASCGSSGPAFSVATGGGTATPAFTLLGGYVDIWVFPSQNLLQSTCALTMGGTNITAKGSTTLGAGNYDYCADYANVPAGGLGTFTITWSQ